MIDVPSDLSREQKRAVEALAEAFNGEDPREQLTARGVRAVGQG